MEIRATVRLANNSQNKLKAYADVTVALGPDGVLVINGFSVIEKGESFWIAPPARKGMNRYFSTVELSGSIRADVSRVVLAEFERMRAGTA